MSSARLGGVMNGARCAGGGRRDVANDVANARAPWREREKKKKHGGCREVEGTRACGPNAGGSVGGRGRTPAATGLGGTRAGGGTPIKRRHPGRGLRGCGLVANLVSRRPAAAALVMSLARLQGLTVCVTKSITSRGALMEQPSGISAARLAGTDVIYLSI